ncbi:hypothetical protein NA57DRAFT_77891 [Rhizodiscina lignyota]|uniref:Uncharacterized protein n=1 Tax=Rhizodiscina lignyota TaxID=1504668 RepID=A0A9P4IEK3_9PEZI|nr:hypothetical protein NA57DRAFT_77891 [Rhizodiscina lignyota]
MNTRRRFEPFAPISPNIVATSPPRTAANVGSFDDDRYHNAMDAKVQDENTTNSATGSATSGLTSLESDTTDDFGKLMLQHRRDQQRLLDSVQGKAQPFSRARPRQRGRLTLDNLERNVVQADNGPQRYAQFSSPGGSVSSSERSDPPLNIPREWGRKARKGVDWLRRGAITADGGVVHNEQEVIISRKTTFTGDETPQAIDWVSAAADIPLPTTEGSPSPFRYAKGTRSSDQERDDSLQRIREWNVDDDFTANSLITSTPAVVSRNTVLDEIRLRELETVTEASFASKSREQSPESAPSRRLPLPPALNSDQKLQEKAHDVSWTHPAEQSMSLPKRRRSSQSRSTRTGAVDEKNDRASSSSPVVVYKESDAATRSITPKRPQQHKRTDSHDILRRLARAASATPSPARPAKEKEYADQGADVDSVNTGNKPSAIAEEEPQSKESKKSVPQPEDDAVDPHTPFLDENEEASNAQKKQNAKTPVVTGAWIDTPAPGTEKRVPNSPSRLRILNSISDDRKNAQTSTTPPKQGSPKKSPLKPRPIPHGEATPDIQSRRPSLPSSALAAVLGDAKSHQDGSGKAALGDSAKLSRDFAVGDSTINSLEDLIDSSLAVDSNAQANEEDTETDTLRNHLPTLPSPDAKPRNAAERQRWKEIEQVSRMNDQLRAARSNIRDARVGLRRVEHAVLTADELEEKHRGRDGCCEACGCPGSWSFQGLARTVRSAFITDLPEADNTSDQKPWWKWNRRWQLTTLGLLTVIIICYALSETVLCDQYCHKEFAYTMVDYGVDPNAPELPFVTFTLLFRPLKWLWHPAWVALRDNTILALRATGLMAEEMKQDQPWMRKEVWEKIVEAAREDDYLSYAGISSWLASYSSSVSAHVGPTATFKTWAESMITPPPGREGWSMNQDEVI